MAPSSQTNLRPRAKLSRTLPWLGGAAALAGAALFNRWSAARAERDHPPIGAIIDVDGVAVHYVERGSGSPIVLIHGNGTLVEDFMVSGLIDTLAKTHRVIAFDRPGHGYTARPRGIAWTPERQATVLIQAASQLGVERPLVVGHSLGTLVAIAWALEASQPVAGLALLSGYYFPTPRADTAAAAIAGSAGFGDLYAQTIAPLQTRIVGPFAAKTMFAPAEPAPNFTANMPLALMMRLGQLRAAAADGGMMPAAAARLSKRYVELKTIPMLVAWGDGDKIVQQERHSRKFVLSLPHAEALVMRDLGHMFRHIEPDRTAMAILGLAGQNLAAQKFDEPS